MENTDQLTKKPTAASGRNDLSPKLEIVERRPVDLLPSKYRVREVDSKHIAEIRASILRLGFAQPILINGLEIVDGHTRAEAAKVIKLLFDK